MIFKKIRSGFIKSIYIIIDISFIVLSIYAAFKIRHAKLPFTISLFNIFLLKENPFKFICWFWIVITILFFYFHSLYRTKREILEGFEINQIVKAVGFSSVVIIVAIYGFKIEGFPRSVFLIGTILNTILMSAWRVCKRFFVEFIVSRGYNNFNVLIVGAGRVGNVLAREIEKRPGMGLKVVGFLDDYKKSSVDNKINVLGKISDFENIANTEFINEVFITCHHDGNVFLGLVEKAKELKIAIKVVPQGFELMTGDFSKYNIGVVPIIEYCLSSKFKVQVGKRFFDFLASSILIVLLAPVFLAIAIAIKKETPGPVFFNAYRYGLGGKKFRMFKFRSMYCGAEKDIEKYKHKNEVDGPIFKIKNDPRITNVGKFLRKYSLDELPQVLNVFKGDMSLVGPRPLPIDQIEKEDLNQLKRLEVRPGITGLWQVKGRSDVSFKRLIKWDLWYINNWSFWLDLNILFQTIPVVFKGRGAY